MIDITTTDLELQAIELLPAREALGVIVGVNATNLAIATNTASIGGGAFAAAFQGVAVGPIFSIG